MDVKQRPLEDPMSYAEAKEIALLRFDLRACWQRGDRTAASAVLARLRAAAEKLARSGAPDHAAAPDGAELGAEIRRWAVRGL